MRIFFRARIFALCLLSFQFSLAQTAIQDPKSLLTEVDHFLGQPSFSDAFICDSEATFDVLKDACEFECDERDSCSRLCYGQQKVIVKTVVSCTDDDVTIYSDEGIVQEVTRAEFENSNFNMVRPFLAELENWIGHKGVLHLSEVKAGTQRIARGRFDEREIEVLHLSGVYRFSNLPMESDFLITVSKDVGGIAQITRFRISGNTVFLLKDYK
jgi:hypothetical protein